MFDEAGDETPPETGWEHVANHDEASAVIDAVLRLDPGERPTKTELSEAAGVPLKTLYLDGTFDHLVAMGLLRKQEIEGEEATFAVDTDSEVYRTAVAFDDAVADRLGGE